MCLWWIRWFLEIGIFYRSFKITVVHVYELMMEITILSLIIIYNTPPPPPNHFSSQALPLTLSLPSSHHHHPLTTFKLLLQVFGRPSSSSGLPPHWKVTIKSRVITLSLFSLHFRILEPYGVEMVIPWGKTLHFPYLTELLLDVACMSQLI